jgi:hypothetical protein
VEKLATTSVSVLDSLRALEVFNRGACMLSTTESRRALAFDKLCGDIARDGDP